MVRPLAPPLSRAALPKGTMEDGLSRRLWPCPGGQQGTPGDAGSVPLASREASSLRGRAGSAPRPAEAAPGRGAGGTAAAPLLPQVRRGRRFLLLTAWFPANAFPTPSLQAATTKKKTPTQPNPPRLVAPSHPLLLVRNAFWRKFRAKQSIIIFFSTCRLFYVKRHLLPRFKKPSSLAKFHTTQANKTENIRAEIEIMLKTLNRLCCK